MPPAAPDDALLADAYAVLATAFADDPPAATEPSTLDDVRRFLVPRIEALLDRRPELLMHILYRVDVAEARVKAAFEHAAPDALAAELADLLIERQLQKVRLRRSYRRPS